MGSMAPPLKNPPKIIPSPSKLVIQNQNLPKYPSYLENPNLNPRTRALCEILATSPLQETEKNLTSSGIKPVPELVEQVLKLSYGCPSAAVKFFRWAGLESKHSPYAWNLMVDLLGKNKLFEPMWDAIRSMKQEGALSLATFVSAFNSYCESGRSNEAIMTFDVMEKYGVVPDIVAVNSLLSAICREGEAYSPPGAESSRKIGSGTQKALEFLDKVKSKIPPDGDSFTILLEGWEKEGNAAKAKTTFGEMVVRVGWSPEYVSAYDSLLTTLVRGFQVDDAIKFVQVMKGKNCLPGLKFFSNALNILAEQHDSVRAMILWDLMVSGGLVPNLIMYNAMIGLLCDLDDLNNAFRFLDAMAFHGAFPDSLSYNMIFHCLVKNKKVREASRFFSEMIKNECPPSPSNYALGITMFLECDDPEMAVDLWDSIRKNRVLPLEDSANALLDGHTALERRSEVLQFLEYILDRGIKIHGATMENMKNASSKWRRREQDAFQRLARKWKYQ